MVLIPNKRNGGNGHGGVGWTAEVLDTGGGGDGRGWWGMVAVPQEFKR